MILCVCVCENNLLLQVLYIYVLLENVCLSYQQTEWFCWNIFLLIFRIYEIEKKIRTPERFRFPAFETINWYAAKRLCEELKDMNDLGNKVPAYLLQGTKALLFTLKQWSQDRDVSQRLFVYLIYCIFHMAIIVKVEKFDAFL